jgi:hypothetical protein
MKEIERTSLILLGVSLATLFIVGAAFALNVYISQPPILKSQPRDDHSNVKLVREAQNLETVKKICLLWAENQDRFHQHLDAQGKRSLQLIRDAVTLITVLAGICGVGSFYIYLQARRARRL